MCIIMKMLKKFAKSVVCVILTLAISACSSVKVVTITGTPGTTIYSTGKWEIGKIGNDGTAQVRLNAECPYYLSKAPNSKTYVPFATNVEDNYNAKTALDTENPNSGAYGAAMGAILLSVWTAGLLAPAFFQKDKPLDAKTNNDLIKD